MIEQRQLEQTREPLTKRLQHSLCVVGGGLAGTCAAITAAREGVDVLLIQDRPILGGNSSSEVRLWALGASAHNHNNNRWAREGGVIDELLVENMRRNPEGNPLIYDTILLEWVQRESNIRLLLNTAATDIDVKQEHSSGNPPNHVVRIERVYAWCSQTETRYEVTSSYVMDATGDGLIANLAGLPYRMGAESKDEFEEGFAPDPDQYGELLGHSIFFMTKDTGKPVEYVPPAFALDKASEKIPRIRQFNANDQGCEFWWIEYGGRLDTIHETDTIKWELWRIIYGVWDYIKNSGKYPEARNLTLEWVGHIPGKRESRRFEGMTMLTQPDLVDQRTHEDAVSFGGWSLDLHPADGVYTARAGCDQYHTKGVYQIPYSVMVSPHASNLFLGGRIISCSHVAFGSTRVMCTCAHNAQAAAMASTIALRSGLSPTEVALQPHISELKRMLARRGQHIPGYRLEEGTNLVRAGDLSATSELDLTRDLTADKAISAWEERGVNVSRALKDLPQSNNSPVMAKNERKDGVDLGGVPNSSSAQSGSVPSYGEYQRADHEEVTSRFPDVEGVCPVTKSIAQMIPVAAGVMPQITVAMDVIEDTQLETELRMSSKAHNYTPDKLLVQQTREVSAATNQLVTLTFDTVVPEDCYAYLVFRPNEYVAIRTRPEWVTGLFRLHRNGYQEPPLEWGIDGFEIWTPPRRPDGHLLAFRIETGSSDPRAGAAPFGVRNLINGFQRPGIWPNAWVASPSDSAPAISVHWSKPRAIRRIEIVFDTDYNHPMETVIRGHPESKMPMCVRDFQIVGENDALIGEQFGWHHSIWTVELSNPITTSELHLKILAVNADAPAAVFDLRVYE